MHHGKTPSCEHSAAIHYPVMASVARPSIVEVRGDGLPRCARSDGAFLLAVTGHFAF